jgi:putative SOS response-associated peptidase YedK
MCGRYTLTTPDLHVIGDALGVKLGPVPVNYNIAPSLAVPAVRAAADGGFELVMLKWGLVPHWSKEPKSEYSTINARAETVASKPAFRDAFRRWRCLIPADGFYEWQKLGNAKQPYYIRMQDGQPFAFAGLWEHWEREGQVLETCSIVVTDANALMQPIHERMPVILTPEQYCLWLDPAEQRAEKLGQLLTPYAGNDLVAYPVRTLVNSPRNNGPELVAPAC